MKHLQLHNDIRQIPLLARFIETISREEKLDENLTMTLNLALEEAVANVMLYAYPKGTDGLVDIDAVIGRRALRFIVTDCGKAFDPTSTPEADTISPAENRQVGGLGIHLVRTIMDEVRYERRDGKNILTMIKNI